MQATAAAVGFSAVAPVKGRPRPAARSMAAVRVVPRRSVRGAAAAVVAAGPAEVDYSSSSSVFPMEACELFGGDACSGQMYPEARLAASTDAATKRQEEVERDYLSYDEPKTVFPGEACDDLGGEFCEEPYQAGVSRDLAHPEA